MPETPGNPKPPSEEVAQPEQKFTQADIDRAVSERLKRERASTAEKYRDYDNLKKAAAAAKTAEDRIADLEKVTNDAVQRALRADVANQFGISPEDRDLFLTGADAETLTSQAKRLAERNADRKAAGNHSSREGGQPPKPADSLATFTRDLFGQTK